MVRQAADLADLSALGHVVAADRVICQEARPHRRAQTNPEHERSAMRGEDTVETGRVAFAAVLCLLFTATVYAASDPSMAWFQTTTQSLYDAYVDGEAAAWNRVLGADSVITNEDGEVLNKAGFLKTLRPLPPGFSARIRVRDLTVRLFGQVAVVHYWLDETEEIFDQHLKTEYVESDVYRRVAGDWKMMTAHTTVVPRDLDPISVDSTGWQALVGDYRLNDKAASGYHVFFRENALYGGSKPETATRLIPLSPLVFFQAGSIHTMVFVRGRDGNIVEVRELHKYNEVRMKRVVGIANEAVPSDGQ